MASFEPPRLGRRRPSELSSASSTDFQLRRPSPPLSSAAATALYPGQPRSLSGIALRAFCLGAAASASLLLALRALFLTTPSPSTPTSISPSLSPSLWWRPPFFVLALSTFHFLEFWVTARRNTLVATTDSFLLTANWPAYAIAHASALVECIIVSGFFPDRRWASSLSLPPFLPIDTLLIVLGLVLVVVGQAVRSAAMLRAGASFNHQIQWSKSDSHVLVTSGMYGFIRHPSYFGFFYWGLGTQLVLGNVVCFFAYAAALWYFFNRRIRIEEVKLVEFFKDDYVQYRKRVRTWIPFI